MSANIKIESEKLIIDCSNYNVLFDILEEKNLNNILFDEIGNIKIKNSDIKVTKRTLENGDIFLYFEIKKPEKFDIDFCFSEIKNIEKLDNLYSKPPFNERYGENKVSGLNSYLDLIDGSLIISKIYYYNILTQNYNNGEESSLLELKEENNEVKVNFKENFVSFSINNIGENASFFILISKEKLFKSKNNLKEYLKFYYEELKNNSVWNSFFMHPSGTNTKLPYSVEPFTKDGYGFSLHHSSKREMIPFLKETGERFFYDIIYNALLQAALYCKNTNFVFYTMYTSTWLKNESEITAPYIDTRLNEWFIMTQKEFYHFHNGIKINSDIGFANFLIDYKNSENPMYIAEKGYFFPDYIKSNIKKLVHSSLNHQLAIALIFKSIFDKTNDDKYLNIFYDMLDFISSTKDGWIDSKTGDLFYAVKYDENNNFVFYDKDYVFVTLIDLLNCQKEFFSLKKKMSDMIDDLIMSKINYLSQTEYDLSNPFSFNAPGEPIDSKDKILKLYYELYKTDLLEKPSNYSESELKQEAEIKKLKREKENLSNENNNLNKLKNSYISKYEYEQKKANELYSDLQSTASKYEYEQKKAEKLYSDLQSTASKYEYEQKKAEKLYSDLQSTASKYEYEQKKANKLYDDFQNALLKYEYEQKKIEKLNNELEESISKYNYEQKKTKELKNNNEILRKDILKLTNEKNTIESQLKEYQIKFEMYQRSKLFRLMLFSWKLSTNIRFKAKRNLYSLGHKVYIKTMPYPRIRTLLSKVNGRLHIFKDTNEVVTFGQQSAENKKQIYNNKTVDKKARNLNVAMIVDEFSYNSFRFECNAFPLEPDNWEKIFSENNIDIFFCESAWAGVDSKKRPWRGRIYGSTNFPKENRGVLLQILEYCKNKQIPTVFWNKEDPTHYDDKVHNFVDTAIKFDHIFTTSKECVEKYKKDYGHKSVYCLMFATQPKLFNPIEKYERTNEIIFAGSWYNQHPERCREMGGILDNIIKSGFKLKIYDRHSGTNDPNHFFPERFQKYLNPSLKHDQLDIAYKGSNCALNINTVIDSDTMFARRVFELMSSNTFVLSNYSKGMKELFSENVLFVDGTNNISLENIDEKKEKCLYDVLWHHTYQARFYQILQDIGFQFKEDIKSISVIYYVSDMESSNNAISHFKKLNWERKQAILYVNKSAESVELRCILEKYQVQKISVISENYCIKYDDVLNINSDYFVFADCNLSTDFIYKAIIHYEYLDKRVGVTEGEKKYTFSESNNISNVLYNLDMFEEVKRYFSEKAFFENKVYFI